MLFNSIEFALFLPLVFLIYWFVANKNLKLRNVFLLAASYFFYGWWDWRFLSLIVFSSFVDYTIGRTLANTEEEGKRKSLLWASLMVNLGFLGVFKYYNFFAENFVEAFTLLGMPFEVSRLSIILPVGISFYTFQTLSYTIDVYRKKLEPTKDIVAFFAFVSFFPQLVAGPIERASNLLPQFKKIHQFDQASARDGLRQILWGLFKKIVIADNCALYVNGFFGNEEAWSGSTLLLGAFLFAFQIYGDFSGYSDIAIGTARLFGFKLMKNFAFPYFSRDIAEFWRRWHISLSTWFRDYLYIPLGGSRGSKWQNVRNVFIIFLVSGFWHGANWTFIIWGALHAVFFLPLLLMGQNRKHTDLVADGKLFPGLKDLGRILLTFCLTTMAWVFFRAESLGAALHYFASIFNESLFTFPEKHPVDIFAFLAIMLGFEWMHRGKEHGLEFHPGQLPGWGRWLIYYSLIFIILWFGAKSSDFIYFQF